MAVQDGALQRVTDDWQTDWLAVEDIVINREELWAQLTKSLLAFIPTPQPRGPGRRPGPTLSKTELKHAIESLHEAEGVATRRRLRQELAISRSALNRACRHYGLHGRL